MTDIINIIFRNLKETGFSRRRAYYKQTQLLRACEMCTLIFEVQGVVNVTSLISTVIYTCLHWWQKLTDKFL